MARSGFERRSLELLFDGRNELSQGVNSLGEKEALASGYRRCVGRRRKLEARSFDQIVPAARLNE